MRPLSLVLVSLLLALPLSAKKERQIIGVEQDHSAAQVGDCDDFYKTVFTSFAATVNQQEQRDLAMTGIETLKVTATHEGGVSVRGWNRPFARVFACRSAVANTEAQARRVLDGIKTTYREGDISAYGPPSDRNQAWWVNFILYVPRRTKMDVNAASGGVAIRNMDGKVTAHATSGGISVARGAGSFKISTDSGGITLDRLSGNVDATSREGAIAYKIAPDTMPVIEARTEEAGQIRCHLDDCESGLGSWTADRKQLRIGGSAPSVRLSTTDAAIIIDNVR